MSVKLTFVFGLLLASGCTQEQTVEPENVLELENNSELEKVSEPVKEASVVAKAVVNLDDLNDDNLNKKIDENVEKTENSVKASARASASFNFNFEEFIAKLFEAFKQNKETKENDKDEENNKEVENNLPNEEKVSEEDVKSPSIYCSNVHARSSAFASARSTSSFYFDYPKHEENNEDGITKVQEELQENVEVNNEGANVEEKSENEEQLSDAEIVEVEEHCGQQNSKEKEPSVDDLIKTEDETKVEEVEQ